MAAARRTPPAKLSPAQLDQERRAILECAVKALIVAHPNREDLRTIFDVLYAEDRAERKQPEAATDAAVQSMLNTLFQNDADRASS
jgi:hypothetical protein